MLTFLDPAGATVHRGPAFFDEILFSERVSIPQPNGPVSAMVMRTPPIAGRAVYGVRGSQVAVGVQGRGEILILDQGRPGTGFQHLADRAAHVDIDHVRPGLGHDLGR